MARVGLNQSSRYSAFSSKKAVSDLDLAADLDSFVARGWLPWNAQGQSEATSNGPASAPLSPTH